jgi:sodium-independent sulfate anion transporter 11
MTTNKAGRFAAKAVGIDLDYRKEHHEPIASSGASISSVETYVEREPTAKEYLSSFQPTVGGLKSYFHGLFPFVSWIFHYNLTWLLGDVIAGKFSKFLRTDEN